MFLRHLGDYTPSDEDENHWAAIIPVSSGPSPRYRTEWVREDTPGPDRRTRFEPGDVVIRISDDDTWLEPPTVIDTGPHRIPHTRHAVAYRLRIRTDLDPIAIAEAVCVLTDRGHPNPRLHCDHRVISPSLRAAPLRLWKR
ncbi:hypothetical protein [Rhodococcus rhodochrous]|uniref:hypothetical protein n=1 Tax=Rhodococcus rhodochrous TaxID=1829 RepID=UPI0027E19BA7|nr:hypothetical protein [Rhodococcus rhodochrous]